MLISCDAYYVTHCTGMGILLLYDYDQFSHLDPTKIMHDTSVT